ncbi:hypothetical protein [Duganella violaceipulchra]|uniref:Circularly permuted type 2 ATP-grasp protein n=1 Tax=Duganella violaceipulchra TaxID=2849652 RepID=A0AA41HG60_9BURK|nr:hypothetical protein [Duganella violaceicalia]MBV6325520.1 hypothetical protein [Duganella violaceicalia]MCP2012691.1 hypothetical protein [Duganella violaceicalia]
MASELNMENNGFYSQRFRQLAELWRQEPAMRRHRLALDGAGVAASMRDYPYALSAWPVIISRQHIEQFQRFIDDLPRLCHKAVRCMFGDDAAAFARYLNVSEVEHAVLREHGLDLVQMLNRHDIVFSDGVLKLIEVNAGSTIGGWQPGLLEPQLREVLGSYAATAQWALHHRQVLRGMMAAVHAAVLRCKPGRASGNLLVLIDDGRLAEVEMRKLYQDVFQGGGGPLAGGTLHFATDCSALSFAADGAPQVGGAPIDAVLMALPEGRPIPPHIHMRMIAAHLAGHIVMPDSPRYTWFGNKLLMALLHEPALQPQLSEAERALVARHIPLTMTMADTPQPWQGATWDKRELLLARREQFVIKKSHSLRGRDVFVGRYCTPERWAAVVAAQLGQADWLAQQYCAADLALAPDAEGQLIEYALIWGVFDLAGRYGGAFVRGMPRGAGAGVVNSANGATEFAVLEETARQHRVTL